MSAVYIAVSPINSIDESSPLSDDRFPQVRIHPTPSHLNTNIELNVEYSTKISVQIYNVLGQVVRSISTGLFQPGTYNLTWDGRDESGSVVTSGVYFLRIFTREKSYSYKIMRVK